VLPSLGHPTSSSRNAWLPRLEWHFSGVGAEPLRVLPLRRHVGPPRHGARAAVFDRRQHTYSIHRWGMIENHSAMHADRMKRPPPTGASECRLSVCESRAEERRWPPWHRRCLAAGLRVSTPGTPGPAHGHRHLHGFRPAAAPRATGNASGRQTGAELLPILPRTAALPLYSSLRPLVARGGSSFTTPVTTTKCEPSDLGIAAGEDHAGPDEEGGRVREREADAAGPREIGAFYELPQPSTHGEVSHQLSVHHRVEIFAVR